MRDKEREAIAQAIFKHYTGEDAKYFKTLKSENKEELLNLADQILAIPMKVDSLVKTNDRTEVYKIKSLTLNELLKLLEAGMSVTMEREINTNPDA